MSNKNFQDFDSDFHNFGRKVRVEKNTVFKPRSLFLEFLIYSQKSQFRSYLDEHGGDLFNMLPYIEFLDHPLMGRLGLHDNSYKYLEISSLESPLVKKQIESIGSILALMTFLGVSDLTKTNILFGLFDKRPVFVPIDLEVFLVSSYPSGLKLAPISSEHIYCCSGISHLINYQDRFKDIDFEISLMVGFHNACKFLEQHQGELQELFLQENTYPRITRVLLRSTMDYFLMLNSVRGLEGFSEEVEQLSRNEIPYFFKFIDGGNEIYFWESETSYKKCNFHRVSIRHKKQPELLEIKRLMTHFLGEVIPYLLCPGKNQIRSLGENTLFSYSNRTLLGYDNLDLSIRIRIPALYPQEVPGSLILHPLDPIHQSVLLAARIRHSEVKIVFSHFYSGYPKIQGSDLLGAHQLIEHFLGVEFDSHILREILFINNRFDCLFKEIHENYLTNPCEEIRIKLERDFIELLKEKISIFEECLVLNRDLTTILFFPQLFRFLAVFSFREIQTLRDFYLNEIKRGEVLHFLSEIQKEKSKSKLITNEMRELLRELKGKVDEDFYRREA